ARGGRDDLRQARSGSMGRAHRARGLFPLTAPQRRFLRCRPLVDTALRSNELLRSDELAAGRHDVVVETVQDGVHFALGIDPCGLEFRCEALEHDRSFGTLRGDRAQPAVGREEVLHDLHLRCARALVGMLLEPRDELLVFNPPLAPDAVTGDRSGLQLALHDLGMEPKQLSHFGRGIEREISHDLYYSVLRRTMTDRKST